MKKETEAIKKLTSIKSNVSSHYFIKDNGKITNKGAIKKKKTAPQMVK